MGAYNPSPVNPKPTTPAPPVQKHYGADYNCGSTAAVLMAAIKQDFPWFGNYAGMAAAGQPGTVTFYPPSVLALGSSMPVQATVGPLTLGNMSFGPAVTLLNSSVNVTSSTPPSMTFATVPGHLLYPAQITLSDLQIMLSAIGFDINLSGYIGGLVQEVQFQAGGSDFEDAQWSSFLVNVGTFCSR